MHSSEFVEKINASRVTRNHDTCTDVSVDCRCNSIPVKSDTSAIRERLRFFRYRSGLWSSCGIYNAVLFPQSLSTMFLTGRIHLTCPEVPNYMVPLGQICVSTDPGDTAFLWCNTGITGGSRLIRN